MQNGLDKDACCCLSKEEEAKDPGFCADQLYTQSFSSHWKKSASWSLLEVKRIVVLFSGNNCFHLYPQLSYVSTSLFPSTNRGPETPWLPLGFKFSIKFFFRAKGKQLCNACCFTNWTLAMCLLCFFKKWSKIKFSQFENFFKHLNFKPGIYKRMIEVEEETGSTLYPVETIHIYEVLYLYKSRNWAYINAI